MDKFRYIQRIFARDYIYSGLDNFLIHRYKIIDFDIVTLFGYAEIVYKSGVQSYVLFQLILGADFDIPLENTLHILRHFPSQQRADIAFLALTRL